MRTDLCWAAGHDVLALYASPLEEQTAQERKRANCDGQYESCRDSLVVCFECIVQLAFGDDCSETLSALSIILLATNS